MIGHVDAELVATAPAAGMASQPTGEPFPKRISASDPRVDKSTAVIPDRVHTSAAAWDDPVERCVIREAMERPTLELVEESVVH